MKNCLRLSVLMVLLFAALPVPALAQSGGPGQPVIHTVDHGETLFSISRRYGVTVEAITHLNGIPDPLQVNIGQELLIPSSGVPAETWAGHVVRPGESVETIAAQYGLSWQTIALSNRLVNPHLLAAGQVLQVPVGDSAVPRGAFHTLQEGETLVRVAFGYGVSLWQLLEANRGERSAIAYPGRWLFVPGVQPQWMPAPFESINLAPLPVSQGEVLRIQVQTSEAVQMEGTLFDRPVRFVEEGGVYHALAAAHAFTEPGLYELSLQATNGAGEQSAVSVGVVVEAGRYGYERIDVPPGREELLDPELVALEQARLAAVREVFTPLKKWSGPFLSPLEAAISSYFGTRRSYNGSPYNSYHAGVDFNAGMGAAVYAPADGTVVLAEPLAVRGNAIVLDHGWGVLTGYWHLSEIEVPVGQEVRAGDIIGRVGSTGLSTGAHLHWELWVNGISVDALKWLPGVYPWTDL